MKKKIAISILAILMLIGTVFATIYLQDNFNNGSIDTNKWLICQNSRVWEADGHAKLKADNYKDGGGTCALRAINSYSFVSGKTVKVDVVSNAPNDIVELVLSNEDYEPMSDHRRYILRVDAYYEWAYLETRYHIYVLRQIGLTQLTRYIGWSNYGTGELKMHRSGNTIYFYWRGSQLYSETWGLGTDTMYPIFGVYAGRDNSGEPYYGGITEFDNFSLYD